MVTLHKYGAAPSYLKKNGAVTRLEGDALPAGLKAPAATPSPSASDAVLRPLAGAGVRRRHRRGRRVAAEPAGRLERHVPRELAALILREAEARRRGDDDCAVLVLRAERLNDAKKRV